MPDPGSPMLDRKTASPAATRSPRPSHPAMLALAWLAVGLPLLWGIAQTISKASALFR